MRMDRKWSFLIAVLALANFAGGGGNDPGCDCDWFEPEREIKVIAEGAAILNGFTLDDYVRGASFRKSLEMASGYATRDCNDIPRGQNPVISRGQNVKICFYGWDSNPDPEVQPLPTPMQENTEQTDARDGTLAEQPAPPVERSVREPVIVVAPITIVAVEIEAGKWVDYYVQQYTDRGADLAATLQCNGWSPNTNPRVQPGQRINICGWRQ